MINVLALSIRDYCYHERRKDHTCEILHEVVSGSETGIEGTCGETIEADREQVRQRLLHEIAGGRYSGIFVCGAVGVAPNDFMPELLVEICDKHLFALSYEMWKAIDRISPVGLLIRPRAGISGKTLMLALPGGPKAARAALEAVLPWLPVTMAWAANESPECPPHSQWDDWV
jgi:molybdopterin adenylyltransferase